MPLDVEQAAAITESLCRRFEGWRSGPYLDSQGVPTIGFGTTRYPNGLKVTPWDRPLQLEEGLVYLRGHIKQVCIPNVLTLCPAVDTEGRLAALADFVYNLGANRLKYSTLRVRVNAQRWEQARQEIKKWVHGGSNVLPGLVLRRAAEAALL